MRAPALVAALLVATTGLLSAQQGHRDSGRLVVRTAGSVVGEEEFALEIERDGDGAGEVTLVVTGSYPADGPRRAAATFGPRRITVRIAVGGTEVAREYPRAGRALVVHDGLLGLLAMAGRLDPGPVTLITPPSGSRRDGTLEDLGMERLEAGGAQLRHLVLRGGDAVVDLWFDPAGRLVRIAVPDRGLVADRVSRP